MSETRSQLNCGELCKSGNNKSNFRAWWRLKRTTSAGVRASALHNYSLIDCVKLTHRQQHALDFAHCTETAEEREQTDSSRGDDQHVNGTGKQVRAEQLTQEVAIDERNEAEHENHCAADLWARVRTSFKFNETWTQSQVVLTKMTRLLKNIPYLTSWLQKSMRPPTPMFDDLRLFEALIAVNAIKILSEICFVSADGRVIWCALCRFFLLSSCCAMLRGFCYGNGMYAKTNKQSWIRGEFITENRNIAMSR